MKVYELNMDGLVGPTYNYAGLAAGNVASINNALSSSNPQAAALQGLEKMRLLLSMGLKQGIIPPHQRPNLHLLDQLGFHGQPEEQIRKAFKVAPELLNSCYSASSMWTANAATVSASTDTQDRKVHFTAANLVSNLHRHHEADFSQQLLAHLFANPNYFKHHLILPKSTVTSDEGAANHNRLAKSHKDPGLNFFIYGKKAMNANSIGPKLYPARQTREASEAVTRNHLLDPNKLVFACQNPNAIDKGIFHNDVISVANEFVYLIHEEALHEQAGVIEELRNKADFPLIIIEIKSAQMSIEEAVQTYFFNSQLITLPNTEEMILIAPIECQNHERIKNCIDELISDNSNPISKIYYLDLKQSMRNGGGPACLRLRVPLNETELAAMHQGVIVNNTLLDTLEEWVIKHYRTDLKIAELIDPDLINEVFFALDELTQILKLGSIYPFQREIN